MGTTAPFVVADFRHPGQPMASLPVKLPPAILDKLQTQSQRLRCNRGALARALIVQGLEQIEATAGEVA